MQMFPYTAAISPPFPPFFPPPDPTSEGPSPFLPLFLEPFMLPPLPLLLPMGATTLVEPWWFTPKGSRRYSR